MAVDRELIRQIRKLDEYDLRRLMILIRGMLVQRGDELAPQQRRSVPGQISYRLEHVNCGKPGCAKCPHGPYWYAYWREDGKVRSRYIGKRLNRAETKGGPDKS